MRSIHSLCTTTLCGVLLGASLVPAHAESARVHLGGQGGGAAATAVGHAGPQGGSVRRVRGVAADGQGHAGTAGAMAVQGPQGGSARRAGMTEVQSDGSATHRSGFSATAAQGSTINSSGSATRAADGTYTQQRNTSATNAATGNSAQVNTQYSSQGGLDRQVSCYNASGATIPCR